MSACVCVSNALNLHGKWHVQDDPLSDPRGVLVQNDVVALVGGRGAVDPHVSLDALLASNQRVILDQQSVAISELAGHRETFVATTSANNRHKIVSPFLLVLGLQDRWRPIRED